MNVRWRFAYFLGVRLAAESAAARVRRGEDGEHPVDRAMLALWALSLGTLVGYAGVTSVWLLTGRGPGGKLVALELSALLPPQSLGSRASK